MKPGTNLYAYDSRCFTLHGRWHTPAYVSQNRHCSLIDLLRISGNQIQWWNSKEFGF